MNVPRDVSQVLRRGLEATPDKAAVTAKSGSLTYAELDSLANRAAHAFKALGVKSGDRVAVCLPNDLEIVAAFHGAMRLGAVWVGVNQALAPPEKAHILRDSGAKLALVDSSAAQQINGERATLPDLRSIAVSDGDGEIEVDADWAEAVRAQDDSPLRVKINPSALAAIAYTSGTTGYPKGAVHSQTNLLLPGAYLVTTRRYDAELRKGDAFPLTILNLLVLTTLLTSQAGATAIIMDRMEARAIAKWIRDERVIVWNGPPPVLYTMAHDDSILASDLESLQEVWSGGADCPETIRKAFEQKFGATVSGTYGLTEVPTVVTAELISEPHVSGSSGKALPHMEVTIRDLGGATLPGEVGEICVGVRDQAAIAERLRIDWGVEDGGELPVYQPMLSYWNKPEATEAAMSGGILHTGDVGSLDAVGNLRVTDRLNLVLNRGGANVYPAEVERVVLGFTAVDSCAVLGVPDERLGERIGLLVQFKPGQEGDVDRLIAHCRRKLARYKMPELVAVVDSLPRNSMGKIDRRALSEIGQRELARVSRVA